VDQFGKEASQTRDYCIAPSATHRAARLVPSPRKRSLLRMTVKLTHYRLPSVQKINFNAICRMRALCTAFAWSSAFPAHGELGVLFAERLAPP
jgi:hypothetical protein